MTINQIIMYILAFGAALGGIDLMIGNKLGYGEKFENGFRMLGPVALAMAGIICLAPVLSAVLGVMVTPLCNLLNLDPGIFGSILAIDMGGCQLAVDLAKDPEFGLFSGVIISSIFGCTLVFNIPVGLGFINEEDRPYFTKGILLGLATLPFSIVVQRLWKHPILPAKRDPPPPPSRNRGSRHSPPRYGSASYIRSLSEHSRHPGRS